MSDAVIIDETEFEITLTIDKMIMLKQVLEFYYGSAYCENDLTPEEKFAMDLAKEIETQGIK